jgi:O-methyltransferase
MSMLKTLGRLVPDPIVGVFHRPTVRYSSHFFAMQRLFGYNARELLLYNALQFVLMNRVPGDYLEFGVFEGANFVAAYHLAKSFGLHSMRFHAFDSFDGLPAIDGIDANGFRHFQEGEFRSSSETFMHNVTSKGLDPSRLTVTAGWFDQVLSEQTRHSLAIDKAAVVFIDCDLYESTVPILDFITDYVQEGTVVIFDDWFCFRGNPDRGEQRAFREWLQRHPDIQATELFRFGWQHNSFVLRR